MRDAGVDADDEVELGDERRGVDERRADWQRHDAMRRRNGGELRRRAACLQREPADARYAEQWREHRDRQRAPAIVPMSGVPRPAQADTTRRAGSGQLRARDGAPFFRDREIGHDRGNGRRAWCQAGAAATAAAHGHRRQAAFRPRYLPRRRREWSPATARAGPGNAARSARRHRRALARSGRTAPCRRGPARPQRAASCRRAPGRPRPDPEAGPDGRRVRAVRAAHSYSRQPSANWPSSNSASARFQRARTNAGLSASARRKASIAARTSFSACSARPRLFQAAA